MHVHIGELGQAGQCPCNACDAVKGLKEDITNALQPARAPYTNPYEVADDEVMVEDEENTAGLGLAGSRKRGGIRMGDGRKHRFKIVDGKGNVVAIVRGKVVQTSAGYKAVAFDAQTIQALQGLGISMESDGKNFKIPDPFRAVPADTFTQPDAFERGIGPSADRQTLRNLRAARKGAPKRFDVPDPFTSVPADTFDEPSDFEDEIGPMADEETIFDEMEAEQGPPSRFDIPNPYTKTPAGTFDEPTDFEDEVGPMADRQSQKNREDGLAVRPRNESTSVFGMDDLEIF